MKDRLSIQINGKKELRSHRVWYAETGYWPKWPDEVLHHIDGDTLNDTFANLQLMSNSEHTALHKSGNFGDKNGRWLGEDATPHSKQCRIYRAIRRGKKT